MSGVEWVKDLPEGHTALYFFKECTQEVTLICPACRKIYISTDWEGCPLCNFKWRDSIQHSNP